MFLCSIERRDQSTVIPLILKHVLPGTIIRTDLWRAYGSLTDHGFTHETVNHSIHFKDPVTNVHTSTKEGSWNGLKMQIMARNRTKDGIDEHLMEFIWQRKNRNNLWQAFDQIHFTPHPLHTFPFLDNLFIMNITQCIQKRSPKR